MTKTNLIQKVTSVGKTLGTGLVITAAVAGTAYGGTPEQLARDYVQRNSIDLSVLKEGEKPVELYVMGESDGSKVAITDQALPYVVKVSDLIRELDRKRTEAFNRDLAQGRFGDSFGDIGKTAENVETVISAMDAGYDCSKPTGRTDHLITREEAKTSYACVKNYLNRLISGVK